VLDLGEGKFASFFLQLPADQVQAEYILTSSHKNVQTRPDMSREDDRSFPRDSRPPGGECIDAPQPLIEKELNWAGEKTLDRES